MGFEQTIYFILKRPFFAKTKYFSQIFANSSFFSPGGAWPTSLFVDVCGKEWNCMENGTKGNGTNCGNCMKWYSNLLRASWDNFTFATTFAELLLFWGENLPKRTVINQTVDMF